MIFYIHLKNNQTTPSSLVRQRVEARSTMSDTDFFTLVLPKGMSREKRNQLQQRFHEEQQQRMSEELARLKEQHENLEQQRRYELARLKCEETEKMNMLPSTSELNGFHTIFNHNPWPGEMTNIVCYLPGKDTTHKSVFLTLTSTEEAVCKTVKRMLEQYAVKDDSVRCDAHVLKDSVDPTTTVPQNGNGSVRLYIGKHALLVKIDVQTHMGYTQGVKIVQDLTALMRKNLCG